MANQTRGSTTTAQNISKNILIALLLGIGIGLLLNIVKQHAFVQDYIITGLLDIGGKIFITLLKMIVVPVVFISLVCGTGNLHDSTKLGRMAGITIVLYLLTTAIAICIALITAKLLGIGLHMQADLSTLTFTTPNAPSIKTVLMNIFPENILAALSQANMLQIIFFAMMLGFAMSKCGEPGKRIYRFFEDLNHIIMQLISVIMIVAPCGVFCLVAKSFAITGPSLIAQLFSYFLCVILVLCIQLFLTYGLLLWGLTRLNILRIYKQLIPVMLFAFSTSSSSASIPVVMQAIEQKLGVAKRIASFVIPLGATINMDGTAIMQGVATVFIAHITHTHISISGYITVALMATLASIGTAGVPGVGLITLTMVLKQVGLPVEAIGLILGVDRLLDMMRTAVNISGDCVVATIVAKSEQALTYQPK